MTGSMSLDISGLLGETVIRKCDLPFPKLTLAGHKNIFINFSNILYQLPITFLNGRTVIKPIRSVEAPKKHTSKKHLLRRKM